MSLLIAGLGTALPEHRASQAEALALALELWPYSEEQRRLLPAIYRRSGVAQRHTVLPDLRAALAPRDGGSPGTAERMRDFVAHSPALAATAARAALADAGVPRDAITHLVTVSCTGAMAPGLDVLLIRALELPSEVLRTHVGFMGCHGALSGLRLASALAASRPDAAVLLCAVELCSLHFHSGTDPEKIVANALFGDGAAAIVGRHEADRGSPAAAADGRWRLLDSATVLLPDSEDAMTWTIGDEGFGMTLSSRVPALIGEHLAPWLTRWLAGAGLTLRDIRSWAVHPGGPRVLDAVEEALVLPAGATAVSRQVLSEHGNMSSPTVLFILERLARQGAPRPCVSLAFGPGLVAEAALLA
ncbi:MAG TPA: type III polyketide synthase [Planctomycetota bacterium]|nr:type III polyketide synthase [Planctomycetota bacterium]